MLILDYKIKDAWKQLQQKHKIQSKINYNIIGRGKNQT